METALTENLKNLSLVSANLKKYSFPDFVQERLNLFDQLKVEYDDWVKAQERKSIKIKLPDGKEMEGSSWETTPFQIAKSISNGLADHAVISKVNGILWDLERPLETDSSVEILTFDNDEAKQVFWHSSAHILGEAMEGNYKGCLCYGPPIENGFYYDMYMDSNVVRTEDFKGLDLFCRDIIKDKQDFVRLEVSKENLLKMFSYNKFKQRIINEKITTEKTTVYKCGPLIDLCRGPHVRNTGKIRAFSVLKASSTYWEGNCEKESLQRIYGISFPDLKMLKEWKKFQEEAAKRDHRKIGREQELFFFNEVSPGSCFFLPKGAHIYNKLVQLMQGEYRKRGFQEVISPNMYNVKLWKTSGHLQHYSDDMFSFEVEKEKFALKPMNCPGHCVMFSQRTRSWKELPLRFADFGVLHRNELSGTLSGLTRVRRFCQDDAHIFCTVDQVETEIESCLDFLTFIYKMFGFSLKLNLSTRPEKHIGDIEIWNKAEKELESALNKYSTEWVMNPGDGAFYGPKIDIQIQDALKRYHQCATIQLDFNLPERFNLQYMCQDGSNKRPVMIHRAILGSVERMIAILTENFGGKWPFWLSPNQICVIPINPIFDDYAKSVCSFFHNEQFCIEADTDHGNTLNKKIRNAQLMQYNFILVVGEKEMNSRSVSVRTRDNVQHGEKSLDDMLKFFKRLTDDKTQDKDIAF